MKKYFDLLNKAYALIGFNRHCTSIDCLFVCDEDLSFFVDNFDFYNAGGLYGCSVNAVRLAQRFFDIKDTLKRCRSLCGFD